MPGPSISKVLSCEPYSSAFCAIRPTLGVVPIVAGSNAPCSRQWSIVSWYSAAYELSGITHLVSCWPPSASQPWPLDRISAGIEASMITSLGTCRLVMPRSESTM